MSDVNPLPVAQAVAAPVGTLPIAPVVAVAAAHPIAPVVAVAAAQPAYVQAPLGGVTQGGDVFNGDYSALVGTWEVEFLEMPPTGGASNFNMQITFAVNNGVLAKENDLSRRGRFRRPQKRHERWAGHGSGRAGEVWPEQGFTAGLLVLAAFVTGRPLTADR